LANYSVVALTTDVRIQPNLLL